MKRFFVGAAVLLISGGTAARLYTRFREEAQDRRITLLVDWSEVREAAARQGLAMRNSWSACGVPAPMLFSWGVNHSGLSWQDMTFSSRALAETVRRQLADRGVVGVSLKAERGQFKLVNSLKNWERLKDIELGYNPELWGKPAKPDFISSYE